MTNWPGLRQAILLILTMTVAVYVVVAAAGTKDVSPLAPFAGVVFVVAILIAAAVLGVVTKPGFSIDVVIEPLKKAILWGGGGIARFVGSIVILAITAGTFYVFWPRSSHRMTVICEDGVTDVVQKDDEWPCQSGRAAVRAWRPFGSRASFTASLTCRVDNTSEKVVVIEGQFRCRGRKADPDADRHALISRSPVGSAPFAAGLQLTRSHSPKVRLHAVNALCLAKDEAKGEAQWMAEFLRENGAAPDPSIGVGNAVADAFEANPFLAQEVLDRLANEYLQDSDVRIRRRAAQAIRGAGAAAERVLPQLTSSLLDRRVVVAGSDPTYAVADLCRTIGDLGSKAKAAVAPIRDVVAATNDRNSDIRQACSEALDRIRNPGLSTIAAASCP